MAERKDRSFCNPAILQFCNFLGGLCLWYWLAPDR